MSFRRAMTSFGSTDVSITIIRRACDRNDYLGALNELSTYLNNLLTNAYIGLAREYLKALDREDLPMLIIKQALNITKPWKNTIGDERSAMLLGALQEMAKMQGVLRAKEFFLENNGGDNDNG